MTGFITTIQDFCLKMGLFILFIWGVLFSQTGEFLNKGFVPGLIVFGIWYLCVQIEYINMRSNSGQMSNDRLEKQARKLADAWVSEFEQKYG